MSLICYRTREFDILAPEQNIIDALDGLPEAKQHCSNLGVASLQAAIQDYFIKQNQP